MAKKKIHFLKDVLKVKWKNTCFHFFFFNSNYPFSTHKNHTFLCCFLRYKKNKELRNSYHVTSPLPSFITSPSSPQIHYNIYSSFLLLVFIIFQITPAPVSFFCPHREKKRTKITTSTSTVTYIPLFCDSSNDYVRKKKEIRRTVDTSHSHF